MSIHHVPVTKLILVEYVYLWRHSLYVSASFFYLRSFYNTFPYVLYFHIQTLIQSTIPFYLPYLIAFFPSNGLIHIHYLPMLSMSFQNRCRQKQESDCLITEIINFEEGIDDMWRYIPPDWKANENYIYSCYWRIMICLLWSSTSNNN